MRARRLLKSVDSLKANNRSKIKDFCFLHVNSYRAVEDTRGQQKRRHVVWHGIILILTVTDCLPGCRSVFELSNLLGRPLGEGLGLGDLGPPALRQHRVDRLHVQDREHVAAEGRTKVTETTEKAGYTSLSSIACKINVVLHKI